MDEQTDWLIEQATITPQPLTSQTAVFGPLIRWFRHRWLNIATRWYWLPLRQQQNQFNHAVLHQLSQQDAWLIHHDRQQTRHRRQLAQLHARLRHLPPK